MIINLSLPKNCQIKVKKKEEVSFGHLLYQSNPPNLVSINIADKLNIEPADIFQFLTTTINQSIKKGQILAKKKGLFFSKKVFSDYDGVIKEINHLNGKIAIMTDDKSKRQNTYSTFKGLIEDYSKDCLKVDIKNGKSFPLAEVNKDGAGEIFYFEKEDFFFQINEDNIKDKIVIVEVLKSHLETKCEALGAKGFVFLKGQPTDLAYAKIKNINDYQLIRRLKKKYIIFSKKDKIGIVYD